MRIDSEKSVNTDKVLVFDFPDDFADSEYGLHIRKSAALGRLLDVDAGRKMKWIQTVPGKGCFVCLRVGALETPIKKERKKPK